MATNMAASIVINIVKRQKYVINKSLENTVVSSKSNNPVILNSYGSLHREKGTNAS